MTGPGRSGAQGSRTKHAPGSIAHYRTPDALAGYEGDATLWVAVLGSLGHERHHEGMVCPARRLEHRVDLAR